MKNTSVDALQAAIEVELPLGWRLLTPGPTIMLAAAEERAIVLPVLVPQKAPAMSYLVTVHASAPDGTGTSAIHTVTVAEFHRLELSLLRAPDLIIASEGFEAGFVLRNRGNVAEQVDIDAIARPGGFSITVSPTNLELPPGGAAEIGVTALPTAAAYRPFRLVTQVSATAESAMTATAAAVTEVIATGQQLSAAYRSIEGRLEANLALDAAANGAGLRTGIEDLELEVEASLPLQEDELSILAAGDIGTGDLSGLVAYRNEEFEMYLGEQRVSSGRLLASSSGVGVSLATLPGRETEVRERFYALAGKQGAAGFDIIEELNENAAVSLAMRLAEGSAQVVSGGTLQFTSEPREKLTLNVSQGLDLTSLAPGFHLDLRAEAADFAIGADWSYAAPEYGGRPAGYSYGAELTLRSNLVPTLQLNGGYRVAVQQPDDRDLGAFVEMRDWAPDRSWSARYLYSVDVSATSPSISQDLRFRSRTEAGNGVAYRPSLWWRRENYLDSNTFDASVGTGLEIDIPVRSGILSPAAQVSYGVEERRLEAVDLGLGFTTTAFGRTELSFLGSVEVVGDEPFEVWAEGEHEFENGTLLTSKVEASFGGRGLQDLGVDIGVSLPFQIPIAKRNDVGEVSGKITDGSGQGLPGVVVWLAGFTSVTRSDGSFEFPAIPPGWQALTLYGVEPGLVVDPALPRLVEVEAGGSQAIGLQLFEAAEITATVSVRPPVSGSPGGSGGAVVGQGAPVEPAVLLQGVMTVLEGPSEQRLSIVGQDGTVRFTHLPAGSWTLRVVESSVPDYYRVEPAQATIELGEGSTEVVHFELVPVVRRIKFTDGGVVGNRP